MTPRRRWLFVLACGAIMITLTMGLRQTFGLFLSPISESLGTGREMFAFAIAIQNLIWGASSPFFGALADRYGARWVAAAGGVIYTAGLALMGMASNGGEVMAGQFLIGLGLGGTGFSVVLGIVAKTVSPEKRSLALGFVSAGGSFGQFAMVPMPDLWDVNISEWVNDSAPSRFSKEGFQESYIDFVKKVTTKPVVGVGRFTSPDSMVSQLKRGIMDLIGSARPSIADPFLPKKIEEGRLEDIRECIGCNICISAEWSFSPIRCTQNPTMMEEWRRDWHPEHIALKKSQDRVLIVGAGPAGLECALWLARRGCEVALADVRDTLGGRVTQESALPGLAEWARVRDHRLYQLQQLGNASLYPGSSLDAAQIREFGYERVVIATGATWRKDGLGRTHAAAVPGTDAKSVFSASDVLGGALPEGPVLVYDDDGSYLASALAERLVAAGRGVTYMTPATEIAPFTLLTMEQGRIRARLMELGVEIVTARLLASAAQGSVETASIYGGAAERRDFASVVMVTSRLLNDALYHALMDDEAALHDAGIKSVTRIGDCRAPGTIAMAVDAGHKYARELDEPVPEGIPYKRGRVLG
ncbi:MAG: MFS transporter [Dongiaceae bacterium]